jgi:FkbM family methyltransferase
MPGKMARSAAANEAMNLSHSSKLIYDVGMNNGDDTAYYLWCGFRVIAIEANPELAADVAQRFAHEIDAGRLTILNVGITAAEGEFTFWICKTNSKFSSFRSAPRLRGRP